MVVTAIASLTLAGSNPAMKFARGASVLRRWVMIGGMVALIAGCAKPAPTPEIVSTPPVATPAALSPSPAASPAPSATGAALASAEPTSTQEPGPIPGSGPGSIVLSEVLYDPAPGRAAFVEILNVSPHTVDLSKMTIRAGTGDVVLTGAGQLRPDASVVVLLDGSGRVDGSTVHAPAGVALRPHGGTIDLLDGAGSLLDRVAWGAAADAVSTGPGGIVPDRVPRGSSIGRAPGASQPGEPLDWVVYRPEEASPGAPNPLPRVEILLPIDGAILDQAEATLAWYPVTGAAGYRLQVARDRTFTSPVMDVTVTEPETDARSLAIGRYLWRVASIGGDGAVAPFSDASAVEIDGAGSASISTALAHAADGGSVVLAAASQQRLLSVPYLTQHKDTGMLLLESTNEKGTHAWNVDHRVPGRTDPADTKNCAIAAVAIMNHFYRGDMSQDRLGFEILRNRAPGPEKDINYGYGLSVLDATRMLAFALGAAPTLIPAYLSYDDAWADITATIDAGRPVMGANTRHTFVITGYELRNGHRIVSVNDPANGRYRRDLDATTAPATDLTLWLPAAGSSGRRQEASVSKDSDGDGIVDFDETERFHTDPTKADTDGDKLKDKADVVTGVFDPQYGYANRGPGRDYDSDGTPTELDKDSDAGTCWDGEEDTSGDGHRNGKETSNFDFNDDFCMAYEISITWSETYDGKTDTFQFEGVADTVDPNAFGDVIFLTGTGTVRGSRMAWAACSVNVDAPSGSGPAEFGASIVGETVTIGAFASATNVLAGVNTEPLELPKAGGTQSYTGPIVGTFCPHTWSAKIKATAKFDH
ncbi:MAG TPA: lamin tail domain-containing protein [Candidatus Sulfomarinibacteraceae bacterium]|nr:lamin tail domain-containing protein [Candidatus Sulfomarinibacteraceae bacterium]